MYKHRLHPDWSILGVKFKISDELPCPLHMGVPLGLKLVLNIVIIIILYVPSDFRVALTTNVSEHFNNTTAQWAKTRPQHGELRALLFIMSVYM